VKRIIATSVLASSILFPAFANAETLSKPTKFTAVEKVDIRKGATTSYSIIKKLNAGTKVTVIGEFTNTKGEKWYRVDLGSTKGWGLAAQIYGNASVNQTRVNFRKGATTGYTIVGTLLKGTRVTILNSFINHSKQLWYRIDAQGKSGWILGTYLKVDAGALATAYPQKTVIMSSSIRKGATSSYTVVGKVSPNQKVEILDTFTNPANNEKWYRIKAGNTIGWVISTAFEAVSTVPATGSGTTNPGSGTTDPGSGTTNPGSGTTDPGSGTTNPGSGTTDPGSGTTNPGSGTTDPGSGTTNPGSGTTDPGSQVTPEPQMPEYVYALKDAVIRRGAAANYTVKATMKGNERLTVMGEFNGWYNVKTSTGVTGWMIATQTSLYNLTSLVSPSTTTSSNTSYLVWKKPSDFTLAYSTTSTNQLKLTGSMAEVQLPTFAVNGIQSVTTVDGTSGTKTVVITFQPGYTFTIRDNKDSLSIKVMTTGLAGKSIIIDAGHGGKDTGAIGPKGLLEKNANLATALLLKTELEKAGATVTLTRSTDIFLELSERTDIANNSDADAFISIHSDSFSATSNGTTTYYNASVNFNGPKSKTMGQFVQQNLVSVTSTYNRGVKEELFYVNRMNELPSILVEMAYISNPVEEALLASTSFRQKVAVGITKGMQAYFSSF
jgi:N-acetylmuramoyl-L-alanine amidase